MIDIRVRTGERVQLVDITGDVARAVEQSGVDSGLCNLFVPHTTAAVIVSENWDPDVTSDMLRHLERLVPLKGDFRHAEGNSHAPILSLILATSTTIPLPYAKPPLAPCQAL